MFFLRKSFLCFLALGLLHLCGVLDCGEAEQIHLSFVGGADQIGASCTLIEIQGHRILVDAGIRMGPKSDSQLPRLDAVDRVDAVLLTHAHSDHTGALPEFVPRLPADVKVYCTPATRAIMKVLLEDGVRRKQYKRPDVDNTVDRIETVPWGIPVPICEGVTATWIRAGHILGAGMIYIESQRQERILITGDVSDNGQLTIPGWSKQLPYRPDLMVMESTYGNKHHRDRTLVARELATDVANTVLAGGKVLIPVFAVGRAQEVILILKDAMERGQIPKFPIYVDGGMLIKVNEIHSEFRAELSPSLQQKPDIFYSDTIKQKPRSYNRDRVWSWPPCCIITTSGMLIAKTPSHTYANQLVRQPKNRIAITGYQAKGTPGHLLKRRRWTRNNKQVPVTCRVENYPLSAHADRDQLIDLVQKVQPRTLFLVHGEAEAREQLSQYVRETNPGVAVKLPKNGDQFTIKLNASGHFNESEINMTHIFVILFFIGFVILLAKYPRQMWRVIQFLLIISGVVFWLLVILGELGILD